MNTRNLSLLLFSVIAGVHIVYGETAPCDLLTQNQVSTVVGASVGAAAPIANTGCSWTTASGPKVTVSVSFQNEKMFAAAKSAAPPNTTKNAVSGVGDEAIFTGVQNFSSLWIRKGAKFLLVRIYGVSVSDAQTKLKALGTSAVAKL
jgi:hypothetical protein